MLHVEEWGSGPAVLLLHGAPSPVSDFAPIISRLATSHRVLAPDLPGYGRSAPLDGTYSFARVRDAIVEALAARSITKCALVGFSSGGQHALALAADPRLEVTSVAALATYAALDEDGRAGLRGFATAIRAGADLRSREWRAIAAQRFTAQARYAETVADWPAIVPPAVLADELDALADSDLRPLLGLIKAPVALRVGDLDQAVSPAYSREIANVCPSSTLEVVAGLGHAQCLEDPEGTATFVARAVGL